MCWNPGEGEQQEGDQQANIKELEKCIQKLEDENQKLEDENSHLKEENDSFLLLSKFNLLST